MNSIVPPSIFNQKYFQLLEEEPSLNKDQALDKAAQQFGYANYRSYLDILKKILLEKMSLEKKNSKKVDLASLFFELCVIIPFTDLVEIFQHFRDSEKDLLLVCEKSKLIDVFKSYFLKNLRTDEGKSNITKLYPNYRAKDISLARLRCQMHGDTIRFDSLYELTVEFDATAPNPNFMDRLLFGAVGIKIDPQNIHIGYSCDYNFEDFCPEGSKTYFDHCPKTKKEQKSKDASYSHIKRCLSRNKPLTGKILELALKLVDVPGNLKHQKWLRSIGDKMKTGEPLNKYEYDVVVNGLIPQAKLVF